MSVCLWTSIFRFDNRWPTSSRSETSSAKVLHSTKRAHLWSQFPGLYPAATYLRPVIELFFRPLLGIAPRKRKHKTRKKKKKIKKKNLFFLSPICVLNRFLYISRACCVSRVQKFTFNPSKSYLTVTGKWRRTPSPSIFLPKSYIITASF